MTEAHEHAWEDSEVHCDDCGSHPAVSCECGELTDLIYEEDPR